MLTAVVEGFNQTTGELLLSRGEQMRTNRKTGGVMGSVKLALASAAVAALGILSAPSVSRADVRSDLTSDHCSNAGGCGPAGTIFGSVTLAQNGTTVDVTVHLTSGFAFAKTGSVDMLAFKFNATGIVLGDISVNQTVPGQ